MKHIKGLYLEIVECENIFLFITMMTVFSVVNFFEKYMGAEEPTIGLDFVFVFTVTYIIVHSVSRYKSKLKERQG